MFPMFDPEQTGEDEMWQMVETAIDIALADEMSMSALDNLLRGDRGFTYNLEEYRTLYRTKAGFQESFTYPARLRRDVQFRPERVPQASYFIPQNYRYVGSMSYYDEDKGKILTKSYGIDSDDILTRNQAEELLLEIGTSKYPEFSGFESTFKYSGVMKAYTP